jgi:hypothetical protein
MRSVVFKRKLTIEVGAEAPGSAKEGNLGKWRPRIVCSHCGVIYGKGTFDTKEVAAHVAKDMVKPHIREEHL